MSTKVILIDASKISLIVKLSGIDGLDALARRGDKFFFSDDASWELDKGGGLSRVNQIYFEKWLDAQRENKRVATVDSITNEDERNRFDPNLKQQGNRGGDEIWDMSARKFMAENPDYEFEIISGDGDIFKNTIRTKYGKKTIVEQKFKFTSVKKAMSELTYDPTVNLTEAQFNNIKNANYGTVRGLKQGKIIFPETYEHSLLLKQKKLENPDFNLSENFEQSGNKNIKKTNEKFDHSTLKSAFDKIGPGGITADEFIRIRKRFRKYLEKNGTLKSLRRSSRNLLEIPDAHVRAIELERTGHNPPSSNRTITSSENDSKGNSDRFKQLKNSQSAKTVKKATDGMKQKDGKGSTIINSLTYGLISTILAGIAIQYDMSIAQAAEVLGLDDQEAIVEAMAKEAATDAAFASTSTLAGIWTGPFAPAVITAANLVRQGYKLYQAGEDASTLLDLIDILANDLDHELIFKKIEQKLQEDLETYDPLAPTPTPFFGVPYFFPFGDHLKPEIEKQGGEVDLQAEAPKLDVVPASIQMASASPIVAHPAPQDRALRDQINELRVRAETLKRGVPEAGLRPIRATLPRPKPKRPTANLGLAFNHLQTANNRHG